tara:strand:- start:38 stop:673 length:636 start_codon:yes stop_codon:yes gene_type:complete
MWAYVTGNTIQEIIRFPKSMVINNVRHPRTIFTAWTWSELNAVGIYTVEAGTVGDDRYEYTSQPTYAFDSSNKKVTTTYTKTDKALADSNAVDRDGNPILDDHDNQVVNLGLKSVAKNKCKTQANNLIRRFNWLVERYTYDNSKTIPSAVSTYVTNVRNSCTTICNAIDNSANMAAFKALHNNTYDSNGNITAVATVNNWPDDYNIRAYER